jgi:hypothetical protein
MARMPEMTIARPETGAVAALLNDFIAAEAAQSTPNPFNALEDPRRQRAP